MKNLTLTPLPDVPLIHTGDDLARIIINSCQHANLQLRDGDILVLAQKIVSKAEGRLVNLADVEPSPRARQLAEETLKDPRVVELILGESREIIRIRPGLIVVEHKQGFICANAGIDHSNVNSPLPRAGEGPGVRDEFALLLPEDSDRSAANLRQKLEEDSGAKIGILIIDSHGRAWRMGTVGMSIGISGFPALVDLRGEDDLFGRELKITQVGAADELAAAASLMMGQANEAQPIIHVRGFPYPPRESKLSELLRPKEEDLFR
ncbi:MAG: coenzyme F420-0:L-glutamate ligase [Anaerolineales bacterium]|uniref:Coenzyme F420-0:L-glutamate ligase n=1 Tax=Candidatus Desulfolinea nitratireducens TaxID=2841698 RepID=A0A8J6NF40_9CHLR|nr:coenzyme F420-0:L-glutamate ligase [Candidatus Desulfolinea nitratireducens]MBL6961586.1 coenzyme F420-0:L-glutamate ligase [Anaerolineales bacterium]